jgi:hypothetical protein
MANKSEKGRNAGIKDQMVLGIPVDDVIAGAMEWWKLRGAPMMKKRSFSDDFKTQQDAINATNPVHPQYIGGRSGILLGYSWDLLSKDERYQVVKIYCLTLKREVDK